MKTLNLLLVGVVGVVLLHNPKNLAAEPPIIMVGCDPGKIMLGDGGPNTVCIDPDDYGGGGGGPHVPTPPDDPPGPGGGGGGGPDHEIDMSCDVCGTDAADCVAAANQARGTCRSNARATAAYRCDVASRPLETSTPWGLSLGDLWSGRKTGEPSWDRRNWNWRCTTTNLAYASVRTCTGPGIDNCQEAWAASHAGLALTNGSGATASAGLAIGAPPLVATIGGSLTTSSGATATWTAQTGWIVACDAVHTALVAQCSNEETACYKHNRCWDQIP